MRIQGSREYPAKAWWVQWGCAHTCRSSWFWQTSPFPWEVILTVCLSISRVAWICLRNILIRVSAMHWTKKPAINSRRALQSQPLHVEAVLQLIETLLDRLLVMIDSYSHNRILDTDGKYWLMPRITTDMAADLFGFEWDDWVFLMIRNSSYAFWWCVTGLPDSSSRVYSISIVLKISAARARLVAS